MGPTNIALVKLFRADQALREAQGRLDAASRNIRIQERRVAELTEKARAAQVALRDRQARAGQLDLDLKTRDAQIEKLRTQQQTTRNNKEYQAFLVEINTAKVDRNKVEDEAMKLLEEVERGQNEAGALQAQAQAERQKLDAMRAESGETVKQLQAEVESLRPERDAAAGAVPPRGREAFERLAEHHEGEAMAAIAKPDRRREEYLCTACMMSLVTDVYNKLHSRDELVYCPSCRRILYIPEDLPPETAIHAPKPGATRRKNAAEKEKAAAEPRARGKWGQLLAAAQGESVKAAVDAQQEPLALRVLIDGELAGHYKGKTRENLERIIKFRMEEAGMSGAVEVVDQALAIADEAASTGAPAEDSAQAEGSPSPEPQVQP